MVQIISVTCEHQHEQEVHEIHEIPRALAHRVPENFAQVSEGIYRSAAPSKEHHEFLNHLGIKSILYFIPGEYPEEHYTFLEEKSIQLFHFPTKSNREHRKIPQETINSALKTMMDPTNHPILIHCRQGKHRTGTVIGCFRKLQNWSLEEIHEEYSRYAHPKPRIFDRHYIESFNVEIFFDTI